MNSDYSPDSEAEMRAEIEKRAEAARQSEADVLAQLDSEQHRHNPTSMAPFIGLALFTAVALPFLGLAMSHRSNAAPIASQTTAGAPAPTYINWDYSFENAQQQAAASRKNMMVEFYTDWCGVCKRMDAATYTDPAVIFEAQYVVPVKINAEGRTDLAQRYGINSYPTFIWMDSAGNERYRISAGLGASEFFGLMQQNR